MARRPHILILYVDQMQHDRIGSVDGIAYTPTLDALAAEGVRFSHAITQQGQCVPSRAVLLTGQSAHECGVMVNYGFFGHQNMLTRKHLTLPKVLKEAGYATAWFGKGHLGSPLAELGFDHGQVYDGMELPAAEKQRLGCDYINPSLAVDYKAVEDAEAFLDHWQPGADPLFFVFSCNLPHPPFFPERRFIDRFPAERMPLAESFHREDFTGKPAFQKARAEDRHMRITDPLTQQQEVANYYSMIAAADDHVGRIVAAFKRLGIWEDTLVLFTADHGDMMGAHRIRAKGTFPYDELYRVPCLFKLPAQAPTPTRRVIDDLVSSQAYAGTLLELAGVRMPSCFTGGSFAQAFSCDAHPDGEAVFFEHYCAHWGFHPFYGVRTRAHKYVRYYGPDETEELYDLAHDPHELRNLAHDPLHDALRTRLAEQADNWWRTTNGRDATWYESDSFKANAHNLP